jgi:Transposase DDE domain/Transposase domain (DUF772)
MFKKNEGHDQQDLFSGDPFALSDAFKKLENSEYYFFYKTIFCNIDEELFAPLYCSDNGRPNAPINVMVSAIILKEKKNWTYMEMLEHVEYDLRTRTALGLFSLGHMPFNEGTVFNFMNRIHNFEKSNDVNLFEEVFNRLTKKQISELEIKTDIARTDSTMIDSNIRKYSRLGLLIEVLLRFYRIFTDRDKNLFLEKYTDYESRGAEHYIYDLKGSVLPREKTKIAIAYQWVKTFIADNYSSTKEYENFIRVYDEHFKLESDNKLNLRDPKELGSDTLQSPDDPDATFRKKYGNHQGQVATATETANPDNDVNLIFDICTSPNNIDDSRILKGRLIFLKEMFPDLEELHFDGAYGSFDNDTLMRDLDIKPIQTAVKGIKANVEMEIIEDDFGDIIVSCPNGQTVIAAIARKRHRAKFNFEICKVCENNKICRAAKFGNRGKFYFSEEVKNRKLRHNNILKIPPERRTIRANVEATMNEIKHHLRGDKLKVRGAFKASLFLYAVAIGINFGRIFRYNQTTGGNSGINAILCSYFSKLSRIFAFEDDLKAYNLS